MTDDLSDWEQLPGEEQTRLLEAYGRFNEAFPGTCDIDTKNARFRDWLAGQGVHWEPPKPRKPAPAGPTPKFARMDRGDR